MNCLQPTCLHMALVSRVIGWFGAASLERDQHVLLTAGAPGPVQARDELEQEHDQEAESGHWYANVGKCNRADVGRRKTPEDRFLKYLHSEEVEVRFGC